MRSEKAEEKADRRVLIKLSGEALGDRDGRGIDPQALKRQAEQLQEAHAEGAQLGVVMGAGNLWRGRDAAGFERVFADQIGMLATALNGLALQAALEERGVGTLVQSALPMAFAEPVHPRRARRALRKGRVVIFVGGTGNPLVTTDTAAAIRALEIGAQALLKAGRVDGVYSEDPQVNPAATRYSRLSFEEAIGRQVGVMDLAALELCRAHDLPIVVFDLFGPGNLLKAVRGQTVGTLIS